MTVPDVPIQVYRCQLDSSRNKEHLYFARMLKYNINMKGNGNVQLIVKNFLAGTDLWY